MAMAKPAGREQPMPRLQVHRFEDHPRAFRPLMLTSACRPRDAQQGRIGGNSNRCLSSSISSTPRGGKITAKEPNRVGEVAGKFPEDGLRLTGPEAGPPRPGDIMQIPRVTGLTAGDDLFVVDALPGHPQHPSDLGDAVAPIDFEETQSPAVLRLPCVDCKWRPRRRSCQASRSRWLVVSVWAGAGRPWPGATVSGPFDAH
jgi:hypothetical protein